MSDDSLRSTSYARVLDLLAEGPIEGLVDGARSIYLNETRLQNPDGSFNFSGFTWAERKGDASQAVIEGFSSVESVTAVGVQVKTAAPVVRTINTAGLDSVLVTIGVPSLSSTDLTTGAVYGTNVRMLLEVRQGAGAWLPVGASNDLYALEISGPELLQVPAGRTAIRMDVSIEAGTVTPGAYAYTVQYRAIGAGAWTVAKSGSMMIDTITGEFGEAGTLLYGARESISIPSVFPDRYEVQLIMGGSVTINFTGTFYEQIQAITISGKTSSRYQRQIRVKLPPGGAPWDIRLSRVTADSGSVYLVNETWWDSYTEVIEEKLTYPYSAMVALSIDAAQFNQIPSRAYDVRLLKVKVPSNYDPLSRTYTGSWDGTFVTKWTDNPAWCFYDLCTNPRYGLGAFLGSGVDKWGLYQIAQYCDQLVPNGVGGYEPRFTCNILIGSKAEAYRVVNDLASVFRGLVYWAAGSLTAVQDSPATPVMLFSPANVVDGLFTYSGSSAKVRHTAALVTWNDPQNMCRQKVEYVEDRTGIARYGLIMTEVVAVGCVSRGQANRVGRWLLYSERLQTEAVSFKVGIEGAVARPGSIIKVADPTRAGVRFGGRLLAASTTSATLDAPVTLVAGQTYTLSTLKADGSVQEAGVTNAAGTHTVLALAPTLAEAPAVGSMWVLASNVVQAQLFRVVGVSEAERNVFEVAAVAHDESKFGAVETGLVLPPRSVSVLKVIPDAPAALVVTESLFAVGSTLQVRLDVTWVRPASANAFAITWQRVSSAPTPEFTAYSPGFEISPAADGEVYTITVYSVSPLGQRSAAPAVLTYTVQGKAARPSNVSGFVVVRQGQDLNFSWRPISDLDAARYEIRSGGSWETGVVSTSVTHPSNTATLAAPRGGSFWLKAFDTSGNESLVATGVVAPDLTGINVVVQDTDGFTGTNSGTYLYESLTSPAWANTPAWSDAYTWDTMQALRGITLTAGLTSGAYTSEVVDIGYVASSLVSIDATVTALGLLANPWYTYTLPWTSYAGTSWVWQPTSGGVSVVYEVSTSEDNATWTPWALFTPGTYRFRYLKARLTLATDNANFRPLLQRLVFNVDVPDRVERFADVAVSAAGATITFSPAFVGVETVQATLQSAAVGDTFRVTAKSNTAITVQVYDSAGAAKAGLLDIDVFGYGERY